MKVLVMGGTVFLGRFVVEALLNAGHDVTLVNRGRENPDLFPQVDRIVADRDQSLDVLRGGAWDCVIDTSGYTSRQLRRSVDAVRDTVQFYAFISTMSVYSDLSRAGLDEHSDVYAEDVESDSLTIDVLGPLKAAAEREVISAFGEHALVARCGLLMGPHDVSSRSRRDHRGVSTNVLDYDAFSARIPYWPWRAAQPGKFAAPGDGSQHLQVIDARDVANWVVAMAEKRIGGTYNVVGPVGESLSFRDFIEAAREAAGTQATSQPIWIPEGHLEAAGVPPLTGLPLWLPSSLTPMQGLFRINGRRAAESGLVTRPIVETLRDILAWMRVDPTQGVSDSTPVIGARLEGSLISGGMNL